MALREHRQNDGLYLSIKHGALCLESQEEKEGYEHIEGEVDGEPYSKYIKKFASLDGLITKIQWYERPGTRNTFRGIQIFVKDAGEHYVVDLPFEKRPYDYFTKVAENIDYSQPVEFVAWADKKGKPSPSGKLPTAFAIKQDGKFVQWKYSKNVYDEKGTLIEDNMGECPEATQNALTKKWNFDAQREWLLNRIINVVAPHVDALNAFNEPEPEYSGVDDEEREAIMHERPMEDPDDADEPDTSLAHLAHEVS